MYSTWAMVGTSRLYTFCDEPSVRSKRSKLASTPRCKRTSRNPYPNTASPGQPKECEAGNEPFVVRKQEIGNPPGTQSAKTETTKPEQ